ncbi:uncharacterized protein LOC132736771 [Ruditapes philippinarum]|uniref:uncharacterized protein LOC132736771 n=1 Tax=Ruditapes philippinarum TaxID=129788 RepID=UPI00295AE536|nr:uncharacterized protein LOC132736771 [Ruditapes philippinarum]XP_060579975.1 uncharacterized protein LOC132736771 [Ruditapes philippinarum]
MNKLLRICVFLFTCTVSLCSQNAQTDECKQPTYCSRFKTKTDMVSKADWSSKILKPDHTWFVIYGYELNSPHSYGKCQHRWYSPENNDKFQRKTNCFNINTNQCQRFDAEMRITEDNCGRATEQGLKNSKTELKFYSQDLGTYFWFFGCYVFDEDNNCTLGYLDLNVSEKRFSGADNSVIELNGLPWELISADLLINFNLTFADPRVKFKWLGTECQA